MLSRVVRLNSQRCPIEVRSDDMCAYLIKREWHAADRRGTGLRRRLDYVGTRDRWRQLLATLCALHGSGSKLGIRTYNTAFSLVAHTRGVSLFPTLLQMMSEHSVTRDDTTCRIISKGYVSVADEARASEWLRRMSFQNPTDFIKLKLSCLSKREVSQSDAFRLFNKIRTPDRETQTYLHLIRCCIVPRSALNVIREMEQDRRVPNVIHMNAVLHVCAKGRHIEEADRILAEEMPRRNISPSDATYHTLMLLYSKRGKMLRLDSAAKKVRAPDGTTYATYIVCMMWGILRGKGRAQLVQKADECFMHARRVGCDTYFCWKALLQVYAAAGGYEERARRHYNRYCRLAAAKLLPPPSQYLVDAARAAIKDARIGVAARPTTPLDLSSIVDTVANTGRGVGLTQEPGCIVNASIEVNHGVGEASKLLSQHVQRAAVYELLETIVADKLFDTVREADTGVPFAGDLEYLAVLEQALVARHLANGCKCGGIAFTIVKQMQKSDVSLKELTEAMRAMRDILSSVVQLKLRKMKKLPVALRLCQDLKLSASETRAYLFVLVCHGGVDFRSITDVRPTANNMAKFSGIESHDFVRFLGEEREHFKQGLLGVSESRIKRVSPSTVLTMPEEVVMALYLVKLSETTFLKLDKTCLAEVVQDEGLVEMGSDLEQQSANADEHDDMADDEADAEENSAHAAEETPAADRVAVPSATPPPAPGAKRRRIESETRSAAPTSDADDAEVESANIEDPKAKSGVSDGVGDETSVLPTWKVPGTDGSRKDDVHQMSVEAGPYLTDLQYLDDVFKLLSTQIKVRTTESDMKDEDPEMLVTPKSKQEAALRELKGRERMLKMRIEKRMQKTKTATPPLPLPCMEALQRKRGFSNFEKMILLLLVGNIMSHDVLIAANGKYVMRGETQRECTVGYILYVLCETLEERVCRRKLFYKNAKLLRDGLVSVNTKSYGACELMECTVDIDRRMVDSLMGLDTEFSEIVEGSLLYTSKVLLENVVLPKHNKDLIHTTITNYDAFQRCKKRLGLEDVVSYGSGLTLLFYGPSGTGKTMLANAIALSMGKKVLLVSLLQVKNAGRPELLKYVFREAKLADAVVFFDECDSFFETRELNPILPSLLQELEKYNGIMILATNKAHVLDEAMNRRITLALEFTNPDHHMRCEIWRKHVPPALRVADNVDFASLATDYELSGGLIKNALLTSISHAVARESGSEDPLLKMEDFVVGARTQLRSFFNKDMNQPNQLVPKKSLDDCIFDTQTNEKLLEVISLYKGKKHVQSMWGFGEAETAEMNSTILLYGPTGVGKSLAAEAIGFECGHVLRVVNLRALKEGPSTLEKIFSETAKGGAILVLDEAQALLNASMHDDNNELVSVFNYHAKKCSRPVLMIARFDHDRRIDTGSAELNIHKSIRIGLPSPELRARHWKDALPKDTPVDPDLNFSDLAKREMSPGAIKNAVFIAACKASMEGSHKQVTMALLRAAADEVVDMGRQPHANLYC